MRKMATVVDANFESRKEEMSIAAPDSLLFGSLLRRAGHKTLMTLAHINAMIRITQGIRSEVQDVALQGAKLSVQVHQPCIQCLLRKRAVSLNQWPIAARLG